MTETAAEYEPFARAALPRYGLSGAAVKLLSFSENGTYLAELGDDRVVIRVHRPNYNTKAEVESELAWMESVRTMSSVRTPEVRTALDGSSVVVVENCGQKRLVDAFEYVSGVSAEDPDSGISYRDLGAITAILHKQVKAWTPPAGFNRFRWDLDSMLGDTGRWGDWRDAPNLTAADRDTIEAAEEQVRQRISSFGVTRARFGLVHADLRMSNLIVDGDEIVVIDFDDCGWSWFMTDLAAIVTWNEGDPSSYGVIGEWLKGYASEEQFSDADLAEIPTFVMLRRLMVTAWIGSHPESVPAQTFGSRFAADTAVIAQRFLTDPDWYRYTAESVTDIFEPLSVEGGSDHGGSHG